VGSSVPGDRRTAVSRSFDSATRAAAVARAEQVGDAKAASEIGCRRSTIRSWRMRSKADRLPAPASTEGKVGDAGRLRDQARQARDAERRALRRVDDLLANDANAARAASAVARDHATRASALEADARVAAEHDLRVATARAKLSATEAGLFDRICQVFFAAVGVGWTTATQDLLDAILASFATAEIIDGHATITIPQTEAKTVRDAITATVARQIRPEIESEIRSEPEPPSPPDVERIPATVQLADPDSGDGLDWSDLPPDWKARFADDRGAGVAAFTAHLAEQDDRPSPVVTRESRWAPVSGRRPELDAGW